MKYLLLFALFFLLLVPVALAADVNTTTINSAPVLDAQYVVTQADLPTLLHIENFSHDPDGDAYTCSYTFFDRMNIFGDMCTIYHDFTNTNYSVTITLDDGVSISTSVIDIIINTTKLLDVKSESESPTGGVVSGEDIVWPESNEKFPLVSKQVESELSRKETPKKSTLRTFLKTSTLTIFLLFILFVLFTLRRKSKEHQEATEDFSQYMNFLSEIGKK